jgi:hypothetical protein
MSRIRTKLFVAAGVCGTCLLGYVGYNTLSKRETDTCSTIMGTINKNIFNIRFSNTIETYEYLLRVPIFHRYLARIRILCNIHDMEPSFSNMLTSLLNFIIHIAKFENKPTSLYIEELHAFETCTYNNILKCKQELYNVEPKLAWDIDTVFQSLSNEIVQISECICYRYHRLESN